MLSNEDMVHVDVKFGSFPLEFAPLRHVMGNEVESATNGEKVKENMKVRTYVYVVVFLKR